MLKDFFIPKNAAEKKTVVANEESPCLASSKNKQLTRK